MQPFSITDSPLVGSNLIESSAGTGKTYTISGLFLRLVAEQGLGPEQILVVTFTKAGTAELKQRIRSRLVLAAEGFLRGGHADPLVDALAKAAPNPRLSHQRLQRAVVDFDRAAIFTIHGFCQRLLTENAFETQSLFDTELKTDSDRLINEVADDFWRTHFFDALPEFADYALSQKIGPNTFSTLLRLVRTPDTRIIPAPVTPPAPQLVPYRQALETFRGLWQDTHTAAAKILCHPDLNGTIYGSVSRQKGPAGQSVRDYKVARLVSVIGHYVETVAGFPPPGELDYFTASKVRRSIRKGCRAPIHPLFDAAESLARSTDQLSAEFDAYLSYLKIVFFPYATRELDKRKQQSNIQFFDDLLLSVRNALSAGEQAAGADILTSAVRRRFKAALVDEFQDTDLIQYEIFTRLFSGDDRLLFMIGDPKQAIYGFRGADVFSYLKASKNADSKYTLTANWRSAPALIEAVNTLFSAVPAPFIFSAIPFVAVSAGRGGPAGPQWRPPPGPPMMLWVAEPGDAQALTAADMTERVMDATAAEIQRLIQAEASPAGPEDIAVLVRTNYQARRVKQRLGAARIPAVLFSAGSVFHTREARVLERVLSAIASPSHSGRLKAAHATELFAVSGEGLDQEIDTTWLAERQARFREYLFIWQRDGFIGMFRRLAAREKFRIRLLKFADGERRLTNLLHLSELLQQEAMQNHRGPIELIRWLQEMSEGAGTVVEAHQLRLESDARAVKILTIHKSKGLEFPIVFYPFAWQGVSGRAEPPTFHDPAADGRLTLDLSSEAAHLRLGRNEALAEDLRLLYVALTRAKQRCYLAWGRIARSGPAALAHLLYADTSSIAQSDPAIGRDAFEGDLLAALKARIASLSSSDFRGALDRLQGASGGKIAVVPIDSVAATQRPKTAKGPREPLACRQFKAKLDLSWQVSSYSSLVFANAREPSIGEPEYLTATANFAQDVTEPDGNPGPGSFPKGTRAGLFFHGLFEHVDRPAARPEERGRLVRRTLENYGFEAAWQPVVENILNTVLGTPLVPGDQAMCLEAVSAEQQVREMEFYFPLQPLTPGGLEQLFATHGSSRLPGDLSTRLGRLTFAPTRGFMRGFIDLVFSVKGRFYLLDWKSNHLGAAPGDYGQEQLQAAMTHGNYFLQYHLYALALHRYLSTRVPGYRYDDHFGGVFYVFLRGVDPIKAPGAGIFADRPPAETIEAMDRVLIGKS